MISFNHCKRLQNVRQIEKFKIPIIIICVICLSTEFTRKYQKNISYQIFDV